MMAGGMMVFFGLFYLAMSLLYMMPGIYLNRYASRISDLMLLRREDALEQALEAQKSFWKFIGILFLSLVALYVLIIILAVVFGGFAAMSAR